MLLGEGLLNRQLKHYSQPEKKLQAQILAKMMVIDPKRAVVSMKSWTTFVQLASRTRSMPFTTLKQYLPSRIIDAGES